MMVGQGRSHKDGEGREKGAYKELQDDEDSLLLSSDEKR